MAATERTYLTRPNDPPHYVEFSGMLRTRRNKVRQFQCCICAFLLALFVMTMVITISYSISNSTTNNLSTTEDLLLTTQLPNLLKSTRQQLNSDSLESDPVSLTEEETIQGIQAGNEAIRNRRKSDAYTKPLPSPSPDFRHQFAVSTSLQASELALAGVAEIAATKKIENSRSLLGKPSSMGSYFNGGWASCREFEKIVCNHSKYRTHDGSCNNHNQWGSAMSPYRRILPAAYADGINSPRRAISGKPLPSAREVSLKVHPPSPSSNPSFTVMLAVFGQFLDHDMTATAISQGKNGSSLSCCSSLVEHPECFPVKVGPGDPVFDVGGKSCMEFVRSAPAPQCKIGPRQQLNQITAFIDGSTIYGSDSITACSLREFEGGRLRMQRTSDNRTLLPRSTNYNDGCNREKELKRGRYCFAAGDGRANENLHLTTMHILWARQHNNLVEKLSEVNPSWDDEKLYQEARRIVGAQLQHISYNEFIPIVLGETQTNSRNLKPLKSGFRKMNTNVNPQLANNFVAAAFRFAHTLLPGLMRVTDAEKGTTSYIELHRMLFNPYSLYYQGGIAKSVTMATSNVIQKTSTHVTSQLTSHLFEDFSSNKTIPCGLDLVSLNIQRGRDHGLPGYAKWREYCGLKKPEKFSDLKDDLDPDALDAISKLYSSVDDIDLYTGALAEISRSDGILGPTFTCLISEQFERSQQGDSFWYENSDQPGSFTEEQLKELRKTSLAKMICDCSDGITQIQSQVMKSEKLNNPIISCEDIPGPSFKAWKEVSILTAEEPMKDWLVFKSDINKTVQTIIDYIQSNQPLAANSDYLTFEREVNASFEDLRKELSGLRPQLDDPVLLNNSILSIDSNLLNNLIVFMNNSLEEASNQVSLIEKKPLVGDWEAFKINIIMSLNNSINNLKRSSPTSADWLALKTKIKIEVMNIKNQVSEIKNRIAAMKRNAVLQTVIGNYSDWIDFKADIIESVNEIVDEIKENMPPPGDPNWRIFVQNVKDQFTNFKNELATQNSVQSSISEWENDKRNVLKSLSDAIVNIDTNKPDWTDYKDEIQNKFTALREISYLDEKDRIEKKESREWKKFIKELNKSIERILDDIKNNAPPPGDPSWSDYKMKIMDQLSKFRNDIPMEDKVLLKISEDGTVFDWVTFKSDFNKSLCKLIADKNEGKLLPNDLTWNEFRNQFNKSISSSKYRIPVVKLSFEESSSSEWISFRNDLTEAIKDIVQYIEDNAPPPGSPDWAEFRIDIRKKFADLRKEFKHKKLKILLKLTPIDDPNIDEVTVDWVSFKNDLNNTLSGLVANRKSRRCLAGDAKWEEFKNEVNESMSNFVHDVVGLSPKPKGKQLLRLANDWADFSNQINMSLVGTIKNLKDNRIESEDLTWVTIWNSLKNNITKVKKEIAEIKAEWLLKMENENKITVFDNNDLESFRNYTNKSFSDLRDQVTNMKIEPMSFDVTDMDWILFKDSINKTVMDYINSINRSDSDEWIKFNNYLNKSLMDLNDQVISLKNLTDEVINKIHEENISRKVSDQNDWTSIKMELDEKINDILGNLSIKDSSETNGKLENIREALVKTRKKILDLSHHQLLQANSKSTEDWKIFLKYLSKRMCVVRKKVDDIKLIENNSKWNEYRNSIKNNFKELDNTLKNKKIHLLKLTVSSVSDLKLWSRNSLIFIVFIVNLAF